MNCFCKTTASARLWLYLKCLYFKCYSLLHFAVCQLLCWAFLFISPSSSLTLWTPEAGIPTLRKLPYGATSARYVIARARSLYTDSTVYQRQAPEVGIQTLFSNAYWHWNARVIEIQTRQQLKINFFHETANLYEQI